jgi:hypothetical protein
MRVAATINAPAIISDGLAPNRPTSRPDRGEKMNAPTATGRNISPVFTAESPRCPCK